MRIIPIRASLTRLLGCTSFLALVCWAGPGAAADLRDLAGTWRFRIDRDDRGLAEKWANAPLAGADTVQLPGMMQAQGYGDAVASEHAVDRRDRGPIVVYRTRVREIPAAGQHQGALLAPARAALRRRCLVPARAGDSARLARPPRWCSPWSGPTSRPAPGSTAALLGTSNSLSTLHKYEFGTNVAPGKHLLTIRVDNRLVVDVGINSHSVTDHTQGNWNGIAGRLGPGRDAARLGRRPSGLSPPSPQVGDGSRPDRQLDRQGRPGSARAGDCISRQRKPPGAADEPGVVVGTGWNVHRRNPG